MLRSNRDSRGMSKELISAHAQVTACLLEVKMMVYTGQGRSKLKSVQDVVKAPFRCSVCKEKFSRSDQLRHHLCDMHPDKIGHNLRILLQKLS